MSGCECMPRRQHGTGIISLFDGYF
ncbi:hypothetical protein ACHAWF_000614 [Thalassiosira exigua]